MKIVNSSPVSSFGGLNFVLKELHDLKIDEVLTDHLPPLAAQSSYSWWDIFVSYWAILLCGGDCAEDLSGNLKHSFSNNPFVNIPSPDRLLGRLKELAKQTTHYKKKRSKVFNEFSINSTLNELNVKILKSIGALKKKGLVLDYDNTHLFTRKADARMTYKKEFGYCPGIGIIDDNVVYIENRNGNCAPHTLQQDTIERMFQLLASQKVQVDIFRADSASYQFDVITVINKYVNKLFIKASMNEAVRDAINNIDNWQEIRSEGRVFYRGSTRFTPFIRTAKRAKQMELLQEYKLVVTKEPRIDGQLNIFTGEAYAYSSIITNDFNLTDDQVVFFYNQRGKQEKEFDILKNDFAWSKMPFSKIEQNTVFLIIMAMCRNIYSHLIKKFSSKVKSLAPHFRLKKFIFRFICIPAKWVKSSRGVKLRVYADLGFKT